MDHLNMETITSFVTLFLHLCVLKYSDASEKCSILGFPGNSFIVFQMPEGNPSLISKYNILVDGFYSKEENIKWFNTTAQSCNLGERFYRGVCNDLYKRENANRFVRKDIAVDVVCPFPWKRVRIMKPKFPIGRYCMKNHKVNLLQITNCLVDWQDIVNLGFALDVEQIWLSRMPVGNSNRTNTSLKVTRTLKVQLAHSSIQLRVKVFDNCPDCNKTFVEGDPRDVVENFPKIAFPKLAVVKFVGYNFSTTPSESFVNLSYAAVYIFDRCHLTNPPKLTPNPVLIRKADISPLFKLVDIDYFEHIYSRLSFLSQSVSVDYDALRKLSPVLDKGDTYLLQTVMKLDFSNISSLRNVDDSYSNLTAISLIDNRINKFTIDTLKYIPMVKRLILDKNPLKGIPADAFLGLHYLEYLNLNYCGIENPDTLLWPPNSSMNHLILRGNKIKQFDICAIKQKFPKLAVLDLEHNWIAQWPRQCVNVSQHKSLTTINLINNFFAIFPTLILSRHFPELNVVDLTANNMITDYLLEIAYTNISDLHTGPTRHIILEYNCIEFIPITLQHEVVTLDKVLLNTKLYMFGNKLHCGCQEFKNWLKSLGIVNTYNIICEKNKFRSSFIYKEKLAQYKRKPFSCLSLKKGLSHLFSYPYRCEKDKQFTQKIYGITCGSVAILSVSIIFMLVYKFWYLILQTMYIYTNFPKRSLPVDKKNLMFDATVCYGHMERGFVLGVLREELESTRGYKLGLLDRDMTPGEDIGLNIMNMMEDSTMAILVLSENFTQSEWCSFSINTAMEEEILRQKPFYTTSITCGEFKLKRLSPKQRKYLNRRPILSHTDKHLWKKLEFALGVRQERNDPEDEAETAL